MKKEIKMPNLKEGMKDAVFCRWNFSEGEKVKAGDVLYEVETDKVVCEVEAEEDFTLVEYRAEEGDSVNAGDVLCTVETI